MGLNIAQGNMYSWVTHTWNTVKGECPHGCTYCYMKRFGKQKPVRFDEKELKTDLGFWNFIFVGSSCDMFANNIPKKWMEKTLRYCGYFDNTYLLQSKNPFSFRHISGIHMPGKIRLCTTIETNRWYPEIMGNTPNPKQRAEEMYQLAKNFETYVTIEPIMDFDLQSLVGLIKMCEPTQVNIGADSGNNNLPEPSAQKILLLIEQLERFTTIDRKTNLKRLLHG